MRLTKSSIRELPVPPTGQAFYRDDQLRPLAVRVTAGGTKSFVVEKLLKRQASGAAPRVMRKTLGRCNEMSVEVARGEALKLLGDIARGIDPMADERRARATAITLDRALQDYLQSRTLKPKSTEIYTEVVARAFADWRRRPLNSVTREGVARRFKKLRDEHGPAWANLAMRLLRALFNYAAGQYADAAGQSPFAMNPVKVLSQTRAWAPVERRTTLIKPHELARWYQAIKALSNSTARDYFMLLLFTGLRRGEGATLQWANVDFAARTLTVEDTKNGRPHTLPLPPFVLDMLSARRQSTEVKYVFAGEGARGHLVNVKTAQRQVIAASGVSFSLHDLRRTFTTIAESLDIPSYALKRLLNHADGADVTAGYVVASVERLREPMQRIADYLLRAMHIEPTPIISFEEKRHAASATLQPS
jgi:integrase